MSILKFEFMYDTTTGEFSVVDTSTGEVKSVAVKKTATRSTKKKDENPNPQLTLEDNKYCLNTAAVELMGLTSDDKLDVKYEQRNGYRQPVIGTDNAFGTKGGNKLTKSNTVACRGSKNEELSKYGNVFEIKPHETKEGLFLLVGDHPVLQEESSQQGDDNITSDIDEDLPVDVDLSGLIEEDEDTKTEGIDASFFQL